MYFIQISYFIPFYSNLSLHDLFFTFLLHSAMQKTQDRKRQREEEEEEESGQGPAFSVNPDSLGAGMKTGKTSKIDRITHILEGRKESKFEHNGHAGGLTNKEKLRKKNFVMVRKGKKSVNNKIRKAAGLERHEKNSAVCMYSCNNE